MNTNAPQPLHVWIFNDASIASLLHPDSPLWSGFSPALIAEVSDRPALAYSLDLETPASYPGIAGLLGATTNPADLSVRLPKLQLPAILAPALSLNSSVWMAALRRLAHDPRISGPRVVLIDATLVPSLLPALALADRIGLAWDLSTPPGAPLQALLQVLTQDGLLRPDTWAGIAAYFSADHAPSAEELSSAETSLAALPGGRLLPSLASVS